jgi:hypothetical protein
MKINLFLIGSHLANGSCCLFWVGVLLVFVVLNPRWDCTIYMKGDSLFLHRGPWTLTLWRLGDSKGALEGL